MILALLLMLGLYAIAGGMQIWDIILVVGGMMLFAPLIDFGPAPFEV